MKQSKALRLHLTENWALKLIQKYSLPSTVHDSHFRDKQKSHSAPNKDTQSVMKSWATDRL